MFEDDHCSKLALCTSIIPTTEILRRKVIDQAASMLLEHLASKKMNFAQTIVAQNSNAFTVTDRSTALFDDSYRKLRKHRYRSKKCHSWLDDRPDEINEKPNNDRTFHQDSMRFSTLNFDGHSSMLKPNRNSTIVHPFQFSQNSFDPVAFSGNALNDLPSPEIPILNQRMMVIRFLRIDVEVDLSLSVHQFS